MSLLQLTPPEFQKTNQSALFFEKIRELLTGASTSTLGFVKQAAARGDTTASTVSVDTADASGGYGAPEQNLINELKADVNQLVTDHNQLLADHNDLLAKLRTSGALET